MTGERTAIVARAARELLDVLDREPELFGRVMKLLTELDVETLREIATWDRDPNTLEDEPGDDCPGHVWVYTGTAYGGDDPRWFGEGRCYCELCGADGDG